METKIIDRSSITFDEFCEDEDNWLFVLDGKLYIRQSDASANVWNSSELEMISRTAQVRVVKNLIVEV